MNMTLRSVRMADDNEIMIGILITLKNLNNVGRIEIRKEIREIDLLKKI